MFSLIISLIAVCFCLAAIRLNIKTDKLNKATEKRLDMLISEVEELSDAMKEWEKTGELPIGFQPTQTGWRSDLIIKPKNSTK